MRILIVNGSPSGDKSITLQTMLYIQKHFPEHEYEILQPGSRIRQYEKDFSGCREAIESADLIVFCYPVYTFLVPSQLHRFIELMKEQGMDLREKYATQVTTSLHFYDITAHAFIEDNCRDLGLRYIKGLSADMEDLLKEKGRKEALDFFRFVLWNMKESLYEGKTYEERCSDPAEEEDGTKCVNAESKKHIAVVADLSNDPEGILEKMIAQFRNVSSAEISVIDISEFEFAGGCLGCFHCAADGKCVYRDGFDTMLRERIQSADATVYAFTIKDHSMGYRFKMFDDRQFCNGHRTVTMGKPVGYLINGDLEKENNLKILIEARAQVGGNFLAGTAYSCRKAEGLQKNDDHLQVSALAKTLDYALANDYQPPADFYGVGGMKIFRDLIYQMRGLMKADHQFYKKHGFYDFPQKRKGRILGMYAVGTMMRSKKLNKIVAGKMTEGMIMPYRKVMEAEERKK